MTKKTWFWILVIVVIVVMCILYLHFAPVWVSLATLVSGGAGLVVGWIGHIFYKKYIKPDAVAEADHA